MSTTTNFQKHVVLTQAQYNARKAAGTLVAGTIYDISDYTPPVFPTLSQGPGININTSGNTKIFTVDFAADDGLKTDGNDQLTVDYNQVQQKLVAGSNITISGNTISATGGGTTQHLYRHDIRLKDSDTHGHEIYFTLYSSQATSMTYAQLLAALPDNGFEMPAGGFDISDDLIYTSICAYDGCICATAYSAGEVVEDDYEAAYTTITDLIKVIL